MRSIGQYALHENIGGGRTAIVRKVTRPDIDRPLAMKVMTKLNFISKAAIQQLHKEVQVLMKCDSPHVLTPVDFVETDSFFAMVTECCEEGSLAHYVQKHRYLDEPMTKRVFRQLIEACDYLESIGIAHRDIKPENILLDDGCQVKLADFGFAYDMRDPNREFGTNLGTYGFSAPELVLEKRADYFKSDVWSCGVVLFFMVAGRLPWPMGSQHAMTDSIASGVIGIPNSVSAPCARLIRRLLKLDPEERPTFAEILTDDWLRGVEATYRKHTLPRVQPEVVAAIIKKYGAWVSGEMIPVCAKKQPAPEVGPGAGKKEEAPKVKDQERSAPRAKSKAAEARAADKKVKVEPPVRERGGRTSVANCRSAYSRRGFG
jgi:serine/threonine protein kinase